MDHIHPNVLYSSNYQRTVQTANILFPDNQLSTLDYVFEIKRPSRLDGGDKQKAITFWQQTYLKDKYDPDWHFEDGESFNDSVGRTARFGVHLQGYSSDDVIAIVTHGGFIRHFIGWHSLKEHYTPRIFFDLLLKLSIDHGDYIETDFDVTAKRVLGYKLVTGMKGFPGSLS